MRIPFFRRKRRSGEIFPDEIFLDSQNLPEFNVHQFEGRIEKPLAKNAFTILSIAFLVIGIVLSSRLFTLQIVKGESYETRSDRNHLAREIIFANRGLIFDRNGNKIAWNDINPVDEFSLRRYTDLPGLSHVVGYIKYPAKDKSGNYYDDRYTGMDGVESNFDNQLAGQNGVKLTETDALGNVESQSTLRPPHDGENLYLSVDLELNSALYEKIESTARERGFGGGAGVVMDVQSGEILALASYPEYSPGVITDGEDKEKIKGFLTQKNNPFLNRVISGLYIPGSIIKPILAIGALEENLIDPHKNILSTGSISIPNPYDPKKPTIFKDWKAHGYVDMREALAVSSDVYFYSIGGGYGDQKGMGIEKIEKYTKAFGLADITGVNLEGEVAGNIPSPEWKKKVFGDDPWRVGDTYNSSIGQYGFQVTPIQMVRAIAAIANGGFMVTPTILKVEGNLPEADKIEMKIPNVQVAREGMRLAVTEGTAKGLYLPEIPIAAKTGTAELGNAKELVNSWSVGYFPYEKPRYAFAVIMEKGDVHNTIGATYVVRQLFEWIYANKREYIN